MKNTQHWHWHLCTVWAVCISTKCIIWFKWIILTLKFGGFFLSSSDVAKTVYFFSICFLIANWGTSFSTHFMAVILITEQHNSRNPKKFPHEVWFLIQILRSVYLKSSPYAVTSSSNESNVSFVLKLRHVRWKQRLLPGRQLWASIVELANLTPALTRPHGSKPLLPCLVPPTSCDQNTRDREVKKINTFQSKRFCFAGWTLENNIVGELCGGGFWLLAAIVVSGRGTNRPHQTNKATIHVPSSVMENVFPLTLKTDWGANLLRQQTGRGVPASVDQDLLSVSHIHISTEAKETRHVHHRVPSREEMKGLILFLRGQEDQMALKARGTCAGSWCFSPWQNWITALLHLPLNLASVGSPVIYLW